MIHIKLFEEHYIDLAQIDLILVEESTFYKSFEIYLNNRKAGILDVGFYKDTLRNDEGEIVGININSEFQGKGIGRASIKRLFYEFPEINYFIVMPTRESMEFWKGIGGQYYEDGYLIIKRGSI